MTSDAVRCIAPIWPAPPGVKALTTLRTAGVSQAPYESLNLAVHVDDNDVAVRENRRRLASALQLPGEPVWLRQVHGCRIVDATNAASGCEADGARTAQSDVVCAVLTADCLPVFLCNRSGTEVAVLHAGWRGLAAGVIESGIAALESPPEQLVAGFGPAIGPRRFEIGAEVRERLLESDPSSSTAFAASANSGRWMADLYRLAALRLSRAGVTMAAAWAQYPCTYEQSDRYFSYRRSGVCGRMASLIWIDA